ncbi:MAG: hypothetical protein LBH25_07915 [Fibromonadaceae bacterium]|jgi:hypothetical protein|nr:hypothetical protein [Fibromonadaceae bacterium]
MKRLLLLFALNCHALTLPSVNNPAIWESSERWQVRHRQEFAFRYSEPFEKFHNGKFDIAWSDGHFLAAAGFGGASLDSIYRELEFSGFFAFKPLAVLSINLSETANLSWVPENSSWQEHVIFVGADFFYKSWSRFSFAQIMRKEEKTPLDLHWLLACELSFSELYSFGVELPLNEKRGRDFRIYQQINLGYFGVYNSFAYPGPVLGFGFAINMQSFSAGAGHLRGSHSSGHTGYTGRWKK